MSGFSGTCCDSFPQYTATAPTAVPVRTDGYIDWPSPRYFWTPSGYNLHAGEGNIYMTNLSYGITDFFTAGGGLLPLVLPGFFALPVWTSAKFSLGDPDDKLGALATGGLIGIIPGHSKTTYGCVYGLGTLGSRERNATVGVFYGYFGDDWGARPAFTLSGMNTVSERWAIISDNGFIFDKNGNTYFLSLGARMNGKKLVTDFGLVRFISPENTDVSLFPMFSLSYPFGYD